MDDEKWISNERFNRVLAVYQVLPGPEAHELYVYFWHALARATRRVSGWAGVHAADIGERIWETMAAFAGYGFPKAHAASYAKLGWRSAWYKTHYPDEFMAAELAHWSGYYSQGVYLGEARRMGLTVRPPHINYSAHNFTIKKLDDLEESALFMGLD